MNLKSPFELNPALRYNYNMASSRRSTVLSPPHDAALNSRRAPWGSAENCAIRVPCFAPRTSYRTCQFAFNMSLSAHNDLSQLWWLLFEHLCPKIRYKWAYFAARIWNCAWSCPAGIAPALFSAQAFQRGTCGSPWINRGSVDSLCYA